MTSQTLDRLCGITAIMLAGLCGVAPFIIYGMDVLP
jgi:hypothetical protein